jgi:hypothetical protein
VADKISAGRTLADAAEHIVVTWIGREATPPVHLRDLVRRYRELTFFRDTAHGPEVEHIDRLMDRIYDALIAKAIEGPRTVDPDKQARRLERRDAARMTLQQRWDRAIADWRASREEVSHA